MPKLSTPAILLILLVLCFSVAMISVREEMQSAETQSLTNSTLRFVHHTSTISVNPSQVGIASSSPSTVEGWQTYRNEKYGFEFKYPASWGKVRFVEVAPDQKMGDQGVILRQPDRGGAFRGVFSSVKNCEFGGLSSDYSYPGTPPLFVFEAFHARIISIASGTAKAHVTELTLEDYETKSLAELGYFNNLGGEYLFANIDLHGVNFHKLGIDCGGTMPDGSLTREVRASFNQILSTFKFTK